MKISDLPGKWVVSGLLALAFVGMSLGCSATPDTAVDRVAMHDDVKAAMLEFKQDDPRLTDILHVAAGYAVFPVVGKGAIVFGGAYGNGEVYMRGDRLIGYASITQVTIGAALGGQQCSELLIFKDRQSLADFESDNYTPSADASAVAMDSGGGTATGFDHGVMVLVKTEGGLMADASVGGQKFSFEQLGQPQN